MSTMTVLSAYLDTQHDPTRSRRQKRKARVAWLLLRRKRSRWFGKGSFRMRRQSMRYHRARLDEAARALADVESLCAAIGIVLAKGPRR